MLGQASPCALAGAWTALVAVVGGAGRGECLVPYGSPLWPAHILAFYGFDSRLVRKLAISGLRGLSRLASATARRRTRPSLARANSNQSVHSRGSSAIALRKLRRASTRFLRPYWASPRSLQGSDDQGNQVEARRASDSALRQFPDCAAVELADEALLPMRVTKANAAVASTAATPPRRVQSPSP